MNAAARAINENNFFSGQLLNMRLSKQFYLLFSLLIALLLSALAVVYTTNAQRISFSQLQQLDREARQLQLQWGQLLLEQASLATPARVEKLATEKLGMSLPKDGETFLLQMK